MLGSIVPPLCVTHDNTTFDRGRTTAGGSATTVQYTKVDACATSKSRSVLITHLISSDVISTGLILSELNKAT